MGDRLRTPSSEPRLHLSRRSLLIAAMGGVAASAVPRGVGAATPSVPLWPPIVPRTEWSNGACKPTSAPDVGPPVRRVVVHHTAIFPRYAPGEAPGAIRQMCINHIRDRKFSDIAYHLLIDRYGVIYQGRAGSLLAPIVGAHAQGFNQGSVGVALIGDFDADPVPEPTRVSLVRVIAWLSELHGFDPGAITPHTSTGGAKSRVPEGDTVDLPGIIPHRRVAPTACPGGKLGKYVASGMLLKEVQLELGRRSEVTANAARAEVAAPAPALAADELPGVPAAAEQAVSRAGEPPRTAAEKGPARARDLVPEQARGPVERVIDGIVERLTSPRSPRR